MVDSDVEVFWAITQWPGPAEFIAPLGDTVLDTTMKSTYEWHRVDGADEYRLYLAHDANGLVMDEVLTATELGCAGTEHTCVLGKMDAKSPTLAEGSHTWYLLPKQTGGAEGTWSSGMGFTALPQAPAKPVLVSPVGGADSDLIFTWEQETVVSWYALVIDGGTPLWNTAATLCNGTTCSYELTVPLEAGSHSWYVKAYNTSGITDSDPETFWALSPWPGPAEFIAPIGDTVLDTTMKATYEWHRVVGADQYRIYIQHDANGMVMDEILTPTELGCDGTEHTCVLDKADAISPTLVEGPHTWWLQPQQSGGAEGAWSSGMGFNALPPAPVKPVLTSPNGGVDDTTMPTFTWERDVTVSWYGLAVDGGALVWGMAADICGPTSCSMTQATPLTAGLHSWTVTAYNATDMVDSDPDTFWAITQWPGPAEFIAPMGDTVLDATMKATYEWHRVEGADQYRLYLAHDANGMVMDEILTAAELGCDGTEHTCVLDKADAKSPALAEGPHTWWLQPQQSGGAEGAWSSGMGFNALPPAPIKPVLTSPVGGADDSTTPIFTWERDVTVSWYGLAVDGGALEWGMASVICDPTSCSMTQATPLTAGIHSWTVTAYNTTDMIESDPETFWSLLSWGEAPQGIAPAGDVVLSGGMDATFEWHIVADAADYSIYIADSVGQVFYAWLGAGNFTCDAHTCSWTSPALGTGPHSWYIMPKKGDGTEGPWSGRMDFNALPPIP
jgi:hypothetical protein